MILDELYKSFTGHVCEAIEPLTAAGSNRQYFRLRGADPAEPTLIGVIGTNRDENEAFLYLADTFAKLDLPTPRVLAVSADRMAYLQTDLGDTQLFNLLDTPEAPALLKATMAELPRFHYEAGAMIDYSCCFPVETFDEQAVLWDLNYFKYSYLNTCNLPYSEPRLEAEFRAMARELGQCGGAMFMYRDFQSRNVMVHDGRPYFIDFQGGRRGPAEYDLASFLWQAKARFSEQTKRELVDFYIENAKRYAEIDAEKFHARVREMALLRTLQVLGAYGFRGKFEKKPHFLQSIPFALANLRTLLAEGAADNYPYLRTLLFELAREDENSPEKYEGLTVRVGSFSYKKGLPVDPTPNGGGFVFDCRAMDNPGRYKEYKTLTGLDKPVIDFLEERGEITRFLESCYALVDVAVENYLERGFTSLMVQFGCTGGQHRSVYSAQHMAEHIKALYPQVRIELCHREQKISATL